MSPKALTRKALFIGGLVDPEQAVGFMDMLLKSETCEWEIATDGDTLSEIGALQIEFSGRLFTGAGERWDKLVDPYTLLCINLSKERAWSRYIDGHKNDPTATLVTLALERPIVTIFDPSHYTLVCDILEAPCVDGPVLTRLRQDTREALVRYLTAPNGSNPFAQEQESLDIDV